jgi:hypothetical protein
LWLVSAYDTKDFGMVMDLHSAMNAMALPGNPPTVNCPIYSIKQGM